MAVDVGTTLSGYDFSSNPSASGSYGFEYLGNVYLFVDAGGGNAPGGDFKIHAFKSIDLGLSWAEMDAANAPAAGAVSGFGNAYTICRDGSTVYALRVRAHFVGGDNIIAIDGLRVIPFNLATDTWQPSTDYAAPVVDCMRTGVAGLQSRQVQLNLVRRGPGDMIFCYSGPDDVDGAGHDIARVYYATFDGTAFGAAVKIPGQAGDDYFFGMGHVCSSSGITHFFYSQNSTTVPGGQPGWNIFHVAMDAAGAFGITELVSDSLYLNLTGTSSPPIVFTIAGVAYLAFAALINDDLLSTTQSQRMFYAALDGTAGPLTWLDSSITQGVFGAGDPALLVNQEFYLEPLAITLAEQGGSVYCAWTFFDDDAMLGAFNASHTFFPALDWSAPASIASPSVAGFLPYQISSWPMASKIGFGIGSSINTLPLEDAELMQAAVVDLVIHAPAPTSAGGGTGRKCRTNQCHSRLQNTCLGWGPVTITEDRAGMFVVYRDSRGDLNTAQLRSGADAIQQIAGLVAQWERAPIGANNPGNLHARDGELDKGGALVWFPTVEQGRAALAEVIAFSLMPDGEVL